MEPSGNSSMISRARACACAQGGVRSESDSLMVFFSEVDRLGPLFTASCLRVTGDWCQLIIDVVRDAGFATPVHVPSSGSRIFLRSN
jgi:hypothetical protein